MIYIVRPSASTGARLLAEAVEGHRVKAIRRVNPGDYFVMWGAHDGLMTVHTINNVPLRSKLADAEALTAAGVPTITVSRTRPAVVAPVVATRAIDPAYTAFLLAQQHAEALADGHFVAYERPRPLIDGVRQLWETSAALLGHLQAAPPPLPMPVVAAPQAEWLGRTSNHTGGLDLLTPVAAPDYYVRKETFVHEYRVHSFLGASIRAGKKVPRDGFRENGDVPNRPGVANVAAHPWIRSWDGGWRIAYDGVSIRQRHREVAHQAVAALHLQFGAVDIGERADGSLCVLEVNRAPGLEGGTIEAYARAIRAWAGRA